MPRQTPLIVAENPTWGVDIGAIEFIHGELIRMRDEGHAVLLVSTELDEILALSDRILVMYEGRIAGEVAAGRRQSRAAGRSDDLARRLGGRMKMSRDGLLRREIVPWLMVVFWIAVVLFVLVVLVTRPSARRFSASSRVPSAAGTLPS